MKKLLFVLPIALLLCAVCLLCGCGLFDAFSSNVPTTYSNPEKYTAGNGEFEGKVDTLGIWWLEGSVTVKTHKENTVKIEETINRDADDDFRLHWRYHNVPDYGDVLYIRYSASGNFDFGDLKKDLTVYLPENDAMDISLTIDAASVSVDVSEFENTLSELFVCTNSGRVSVKIDSADEVRISGQNDEDVPSDNREFFFRANGTVYDLGISSSYAKLDVAAKSVRSGDVGTVFADLSLSVNEARDLTVTNSGGKIDATVLKFDSLDIETRSEPCTLKVSPDTAFKLTVKDKDRFGYKMTPKSVSVELDGVTQSGSEYTVGNGKSSISFASESDLRILAAQVGSTSHTRPSCTPLSVSLTRTCAPAGFGDNMKIEN